MADGRDKEFFDAISGADPVAAAQAIDLLHAAISGDNAIERAIEWIGDNMEPQDVFDRDKLDAWARMAGYTNPPEGTTFDTSKI